VTVSELPEVLVMEVADLVIAVFLVVDI
jgi:hypothetical protein